MPPVVLETCDTAAAVVLRVVRAPRLQPTSDWEVSAGLDDYGQFIAVNSEHIEVACVAATAAGAVSH